MALPPAFSLPDLINGSATPDYRLSDSRAYFFLRSEALDRSVTIQEPIGFDAAEWTLTRDVKYHGVNFEFTGDEATLKFQQKLAIDFIEEVYAGYGPNAELFLIWGLIDSTGELPLQKLRLILSKRNKKGGELTVPSEQYSLHPDIRAKWDTTLSMDSHQALVNDANLVPVPIVPPAPSVLVLHSQRIKQTTTIKTPATAQDTDWQSFANEGASVLEGGGLLDVGGGSKVYRKFYLSFPLESERASPAEVQTYSGSYVAVSTDKPEDSAKQILVTTQDGNYTFDIELDFQVDARLQKRSISIDPPIILVYILTCSLIVGTEKHTLYGPIGGNPNSRFMGAVRAIPSAFSLIVDLPKNTPVYFYAELEILPNRSNWRGTDVRLLVNKASINISANTYAPPSSCPAYPVIDVLKQWVACLTGRQNAVQSSYYSFAHDSQPVDGGGAHRMRTNGYYLRGFTGKPLQNSLQKELESLQAIDAIGVAYKPMPDGDLLVVEPIAYFYRDTEMMAFDSYTILEEETAQEYLHPSVDVGYSKYPDEGPQVLDEFNTEQQYVLPMRDGSTYEAVSDLIASGYALELTRRAQFSTTPNDSTTYDDDGFIVCSSQLVKLTPELSQVTVPVVFVTVSGLASMAFALDQKPLWFSKGITFLVAGTTYNDGLFKIVDYIDSHIFGVARAIAVLDRAITNESATATLSISTNASFQAERNEDFDVVEGVLDPSTTYNIRLSPRFNFLRHAPYIGGGLVYNNGSEPIRCTFSKNNGSLRTKLKDSALGDLNIDTRRLIQHTDNLQVADLRYPVEPLWSPERIKVSTKLTIDQMLYLRACLQGTHPDSTLHYGYVTLTGGDQPVYGFPLSISFNPVKGEAVLTLLKKFVSLTQQQGGQRGCSFYSNYTFSDFESLAPGTIDPWIYRCLFGNFQ